MLLNDVLQVTYRAQVKLQTEALNRVKLMERELGHISELRMKEESATDLAVGLFDTKRNIRVTKGREALEREQRERERSEVDLELDFLAPFLVKYDVNQMTRQMALQVMMMVMMTMMLMVMIMVMVCCRCGTSVWRASRRAWTRRSSS